MVTGNTVADPANDGIHVATATAQAIISANNIHYPGRHGILVDALNIGIIGNGVISIGNSNSGVSIGANAANVRIIGNRLTGFDGVGGKAVDINAAVVGV